MVMHWKTVNMAKPILSKLVMPRFGPSQYSWQVSDSCGILQVKTPCFIFNQPQRGSKRWQKRETITHKFILLSHLQLFRMSSVDDHHLDKWLNNQLIRDVRLTGDFTYDLHSPCQALEERRKKRRIDHIYFPSISQENSIIIDRFSGWKRQECWEVHCMSTKLEFLFRLRRKRGETATAVLWQDVFLLHWSS